MELSQEKICEIRKVAKQFAICFGVIAVALIIAAKILQIWEDEEWWLMITFIITSSALAAIVFCIIACVVIFLVGQKERDDRNELQINELKNTVQELQARKDHVRDESPLINLTKQQQDAIIDLLVELPPHVTKVDDAINMKEWARFIRALEELNYISPAKSADTKGLRNWVILLADDKSVPSPSAFNQALRDAKESNIEDAVETIRKILNIDKK